MFYAKKPITLKNGSTAVLRSPVGNDAEMMLEMLKTCCNETDFLLRSANDWNITVEKEAAYLESVVADNYIMMILCDIDGVIAGNCHIQFQRNPKTAHRASIGISLLKKYWSQGIGTIMLTELEKAARERGILQMELEFIEGNDRAEALYRKIGFEHTSIIPHAIHQPDGRFVNIHYMIKPL